MQDAREQAERLVHDDFVSETGAERLPQLSRYLRAAAHRLDKAGDNPARDEQLAWQVHDLEQLRVSLFAQQLGTPVPVSEKRIRKVLAGLG